MDRGHLERGRRGVALGSPRCDGSIWSLLAARSCGPRCPKLGASGCADCSVVRRSAATRLSCWKRTRSVHTFGMGFPISGRAARPRPRDTTDPARTAQSAPAASARRPPRPRVRGGRRPPAGGPAPDRPGRLRGRAGRPLYFPALPPGRGRGAARTGPPSSSGLGFRPFKAATRVRIPLGAHNRIAHAPVEESGRPHRPVKAEIAGSKPVGRADLPAVSR